MKIHIKNILVPIACLFLAGAGNTLTAQEKKDAPDKKLPLDWHMLAHEKNGVYGSGIKEAYELLKGTKPAKKVVVAVIDTGCDDLHEDLAGNLWVNPREVAGDGIDNDNNGYTDDIHGWNFLGSADGKTLEYLTNEYVRYFLSIRDRIDELHSGGRNKKEQAEYDRIVSNLERSELGQTYMGYLRTDQVIKYIEQYGNDLPKENGWSEVDMDKFSTIDFSGEKDPIKVNAIFYLYFGLRAGKNWNDIISERFVIKEDMRKHFESILKDTRLSDERDTIGDDPADVNDRFYGNDMLVSRTAGHGTFVAGLIGAVRNNGTGIDGIADNVELMIIKAAASGSEYDKDVASAIRYAADNGADIINISLSSSLSPNHKWVNDAIGYAAKKGVLVVNSTGNSSRDNDTYVSYPSGKKNKKKYYDNFIKVGASTPDGNILPSSDYGRTSIDVFAPGQDIYSLDTGDNYRKMSGTDFAAPVVTGISAMLLSYFPDLKPAQIKDIIIRSAVIRNGEEINIPYDPNISNEPAGKGSFSDMCVGGGIVSAPEAVRLASEISKHKIKSGKSPGGETSQDIMSLPLRKRYTDETVKILTRRAPGINSAGFMDIISNWRKVKASAENKAALVSALENNVISSLQTYIIMSAADPGKAVEPPLQEVLSEGKRSGFPFSKGTAELLEIWTAHKNSDHKSAFKAAERLLAPPVSFEIYSSWSILDNFLSSILLSAADEEQTRLMIKLLNGAVVGTEGFANTVLSESLLDFEGKLAFFEMGLE